MAGEPTPQGRPGPSGRLAREPGPLPSSCPAPLCSFLTPPSLGGRGRGSGEASWSQHEVGGLLLLQQGRPVQSERVWGLGVGRGTALACSTTSEILPLPGQGWQDGLLRTGQGTGDSSDSALLALQVLAQGGAWHTGDRANSGPAGRQDRANEHEAASC